MTGEEIEHCVPFPPGYCHFPRYSEEYFKQITAEQLVTKLVKGYKRMEWQRCASADVVIGGEQQEADGGFDNVEYVLDAASLGMAKGVIMLGHVVSEQAGTEDYANWLRTFIRDVRIQSVPAEEPFW